MEASEVRVSVEDEPVERKLNTEYESGDEESGFVEVGSDGANSPGDGEVESEDDRETKGPTLRLNVKTVGRHKQYIGYRRSQSISVSIVDKSQRINFTLRLLSHTYCTSEYARVPNNTSNYPTIRHAR